MQAVLELVAEGISFVDIVRDCYPDLDIADVKACVQYAVSLVEAEEINVSASTE